MEYILTNNGFQPKKEVEKAEKILNNIDYIRHTLDIMEELIDTSIKLDRTREDYTRHLNAIKDHIWYLQESYFYPINNKENE